MSNNSRIHVDLIKGLGEEKAQDFVREYENSKRVLSRIRELLKKEIEKSHIEEEDLDQLEPLAIAKIIGKRQAYRNILKYFPDQG